MTNPFVGSWTYRSLLNDPDLQTAFNDLQFGLGSGGDKGAGRDRMANALSQLLPPAQ